MLPVHDVLPHLAAALIEGTAAVLVAAPGAGKTTVVPLALMDQPWAAAGKIIVLEPRRLAARAAAARMAQTLGDRVGGTVGYRVRMDSKVSARTRIELVTEGVFTRMILDDPGLEGVACVVFDEFHERSLDGDLGLALARDAQGLLRPDLRLLVMSATLDAARVADLLGGAAVIESAGRQFPVETRHLGRDQALRIEAQAVRAVRRALAEDTGSVLVFLPGQGEILRAAEQLAEVVRDPAVDIAPLFGAMDPRAQDLAIVPSPPGRRKVVLATSIAETSLTIEGVRVVVDCGLSRIPRYDPASGLTRLDTVRVTRASADQRRGRAGRTEPGVCLRLWDAAEDRSLVPFGRPEILDTDLSRLALDLARWGAKDASGLAFLDPPPAAAMAEARALLARLQALDGEGNLTAHGRALTALPLPPRLAHMVLKGAEAGSENLAARIAVVLTERGLGGTDAHLLHRLERFERDGSARARDAKALADRWADAARKALPPSRGKGAVRACDSALLLAEAYPERIARARGKPGEFLLASGRGVFVDATDALARATWLAVGELGGGAARDRILLAAPLDEPALRAAFADRFVRETAMETGPGGRLQAVERLKLGEIVLQTRVAGTAPEALAGHLLDQVRAKGLEALPWSEAAIRLRQRAAFLHALDDTWPDLSDDALLADPGDWLTPLLAGARRLSDLPPQGLADAMRGQIGWERLQSLDRLAPDRFTTPAGPSHAIDYAAEGGPRVEVRVQELYGLDRHPMLADGRAPLTLALTSPARRPIQVTTDLPGFWRGSWREVRGEMRGRYPRHVWPESPATAAPTTRAKPRGT